MGFVIRDVLLGLGIMLGGLLLSQKYDTSGVIITSVITTLVLIVIVGRRLKSRLNEVFVTGLLVGIPETYVFLIQPNINELMLFGQSVTLPTLPGNVELFFGIAIVTRVILLVLQFSDNPWRDRIRRLTHSG